MALIEKLKNIANAIRSKTNKTEELTLEQMASEVEGIDTLQGLDFSSIYDQEQADELNQYYKDAIDYSVEVTEKTKGRYIGNSEFANDGRLVYLILKECKGFANYAFNASGIQFADIEITGNPNNLDMHGIFSYTPLYKITMKGLEFIPQFVNTFFYCNALKYAYLKGWKQGDMGIGFSKLSVDSIKYIIWHALNGTNNLGYEDEGATSRILTLNATPYNSWETWKLTKPSVKDCEFLGVSKDEITKYDELTWEDIALNIKRITVGK